MKPKPAANPDARRNDRLKLVGAIGGLVVAAGLITWQLWPAPVATPSTESPAGGEPTDHAALPQTQPARTNQPAAQPPEPARGNFRVAPTQ